MEERYSKEIKAFGKRLKHLRKAKKMSQLDLEIGSKINRAEISKIENGLKNIEFITIVKLAAAMDIEIVDFFKKS